MGRRKVEEAVEDLGGRLRGPPEPKVPDPIRVSQASGNCSTSTPVVAQLFSLAGQESVGSAADTVGSQAYPFSEGSSKYPRDYR